MNKQVNSIVIVGGGTAGWMTAAALSKHFQNTHISIKLVESSQLGTIGVGEATIPTLRRFYTNLGFTDIDVIRATNATCKLGIEFRDWYCSGSSFIHPFGLFGQNANDIPFHHYWLKLRQLGDNTDLADYSLGVNLAKQNKFCFPAPKPKSSLQIFDWALHFDASAFAALMRDFSVRNNVEVIDNKITQVVVNTEDGSIESLLFENAETLQADLYIDCSGFKGLLIEQALNTGYENWDHWLVCDKAVAIQSESVDLPIVRTISQAKIAGWQWRIPLQHRQGNGYVYCSQYLSDEEATQSLLMDVEGKTIGEPRNFSFIPGRRKQVWNKNCVAIGLSAGFLEPLESTSIALIETAINRLTLTFSSSAASYGINDINRFNEVTQMEYERVRDFIILHYKINQREGLPLWDYCRSMPIPEELENKMKLFKNKGKLERYPWEIFGADSWLAIYSGFNYLPDSYDINVDNIQTSLVESRLTEMRHSINRLVESIPEHSEFLKKFCDYSPDFSSQKNCNY